jgi:amino acid transporter
MATRVVFALSFDRLLPTKFADVHEGTRAPLYALAFVTVALVGWQVLGTYTGWQTLFRNLILVVYVIFVIGLTAAALLPYRRRDLYDASPQILRGRWLGLPRITLVSGVAALLFAFLAYLLATKPAYYGSYGWNSILTLVITGTLGGVLYAASRWWHRRRGLDLSMAMRELPPE